MALETKVAKTATKTPPKYIGPYYKIGLLEKGVLQQPAAWKGEEIAENLKKWPMFARFFEETK